MKQENSQNDKKQKINNSTRELLDTALAAAFYVIACVYIPFAFYVPMGDLVSSLLALAICVLGIAVLARIAKTFRATVGYTVIVALLVLFGGMILPVAIFSAFASACCIFAHLMTKKASPFIWGLPLIALIMSALISRSIMGILLSVITLPCSLMLIYSVKKRIGKVGAVCRISLGICISLAVIFVCAVWRSHAELSMSAARALIDTARGQLTVLLESAAEEIEMLLGYELTSADANNVIDASVSALFNLLPALIITVSNIVAYIIHSLYLSVAYISEKDKKRVIPMLAFNMSLTSAIVYIASLVLAFALTSDSVALYGTAAENVMIVLAPGLILTALAALRAFTSRKGPSCLGTLVYFGVIFMLVSLSVYSIIGVALAGAIVVILANIAKKNLGKMR